MTIIFAEMLKWKRNKTVWGIFVLTVLLGLFAVERACSIPRSSPVMDSFGDMYTLAFKNLTGLCLLTFGICIIGGFIAGAFPDLNTETILQAGFLFLSGGILIPVAMLPVIFLATLSKGYILPIGGSLLYLVPVVISPSQLMGLHPLASVMGIYFSFSPAAAEMVGKWTGGAIITASPFSCFISLFVIGSISAIVSVLVLRQQTY